MSRTPGAEGHALGQGGESAAPVDHVINQWPDQGFSNCSCGGWGWNGHDMLQAVEEFNHHRARAAADQGGSE